MGKSAKMRECVRKRCVNPLKAPVHEALSTHTKDAPLSSTFSRPQMNNAPKAHENIREMKRANMLTDIPLALELMLRTKTNWEAY